VENQEIEGMKRRIDQLQTSQEITIEILTDLMQKFRPFLVSQTELAEVLEEWIEKTEKRLSSVGL